MRNELPFSLWLSILQKSVIDLNLSNQQNSSRRNKETNFMKYSKIRKFIMENENLFWWIKREKKKDISLNLLVETMLSYGNVKNIKKMFQLLGIKRVSDIFHRQISQKRVNYNPRTINYFNLYFKKHA